jgi:magnesium transporter
MRIRIPRFRRAATALRELARRDPDSAEAYLDTHQEEWEGLAEAEPHNAADILEALDEVGAAELLAELGTTEAAEILDEMRPEAAADVLEEMPPEEAAEFIAEMDADQAADLLGAFDEETRDLVLAALRPEASAEIAGLMQYPPDSAGGMMTREIASLPRGITAGEAIEALRRLHDELGSNLRYVYVVDDDRLLLGVVSFRDLVFARPGTGLDEVMVHDPVRVTASTDREEVTELVQRYHLIAVPVTDDAGRLIGIVRFDEALEAARAEASEDMSVMVGAGAEETVFTPVPLSVQRRLPWITVNLFIGLLIAFAIDPFRETIEQNSELAILMPMVALLGGNSGAQSLAVIIRSMAVGELPHGRAWRAIRREVMVGVVNAIAMAMLAGIAAWVVSGSSTIATVVLVAVGVNMVAAGFAGAGIPVAMRRIGLDPALASNIFLTMITDLVGFGGFLLTATLLL